MEMEKAVFKRDAFTIGMKDQSLSPWDATSCDFTLGLAGALALFSS